MKIYTKTGDKGMTQLASGQRVSKASDRVEAYGSIDTLNSWIGRIQSQSREIYPEIAIELLEIQQILFDCQTDLANTESNEKTWRVEPTATSFLEQRIDDYTEQLPAFTRFILPGGTLLASDCHFARTLTRTAERNLVKLTWTSGINPAVMTFLNRLSDYFFNLAREFNRFSQYEDIFYEDSKKRKSLKNADD